MLDDLTLNDDVDDVAQARAPREHVFAELELVARAAHQDAADEHDRLLDHALALQQVGDVAHAEVLGNVDGLVAIERTRRFKPVLAGRNRDPADQRRQQDQGEDCASSHDERVARPRRGPLGLRQTLGLECGARAARREPLAVGYIEVARRRCGRTIVRLRRSGAGAAGRCRALLGCHVDSVRPAAALRRNMAEG